VVASIENVSRWHPSRCRACGLEATADEPISAQAFCSKCGTARELANIEQLTVKRGPFYEHWVRRSFMANRRRLLSLDQPKG
jgi:hypothetical protein